MSRHGRWRLRSLRLRAFVVTVLVAILPLGFVALASVNESGVGARMLADCVAAAAAAADVADDPRAIAEVAARHGVRLRVLDGEHVRIDVDRHEDGASIAFAEVFFGPDGAPSLDEIDASRPPVAARAEIVGARTGGADQGCTSAPGGKLLVCHAARRTASGAVVLAEGASRRAVRALYDLRYQLLKLTLIVVPCAIALGWWLGWRMVRPIERLRDQALVGAERLAGPSRELVLPRRDEFGELAAALNHLLADIRGHARAHEAALADLGHELKSPVAAIVAAADALATGPAEPERVARLSRVLGDASRRLDGLLHQFLELARAEAGMVGEARTEIDLGALVRGLVDGYRGDERLAHVRLGCTIDGEVVIVGVAQRVETALRNLIENAASFARSRVDIHVRGVDDGVAIAVDDDGPGIDPAVVPRIFERFYSKRTSGRGSGLGLALVRAIAEAHGGRAEVRSQLGSGTSFAIRLPRRPREG